MTMKETDRRQTKFLSGIEWNSNWIGLFYCCGIVQKCIFLDESTLEIEYIIIIYLGGRRENESCIEHNPNTHIMYINRNFLTHF